MRRQIHLERALRMSQVQLQRQRSHQHEGECCEQGQPVGWLHRLHPEHTFERSQNERTRHQSRDEGVKNDQDAPLELHFVRVHESFHGYLHEPPYRTEPSMPL